MDRCSNEGGPVVVTGTRSCVGGIRVKRMPLEGATYPLWGVPKGMGRGGGSSRKQTVVDESRKETADRVARYHADFCSR